MYDCVASGYMLANYKCSRESRSEHERHSLGIVGEQYCMSICIGYIFNQCHVRNPCQFVLEPATPIIAIMLYTRWRNCKLIMLSVLIPKLERSGAEP